MAVSVRVDLLRKYAEAVISPRRDWFNLGLKCGRNMSMCLIGVYHRHINKSITIGRSNGCFLTSRCRRGRGSYEGCLWAFEGKTIGFCCPFWGYVGGLGGLGRRNLGSCVEDLHRGASGSIQGFSGVSFFPLVQVSYFFNIIVEKCID